MFKNFYVGIQSRQERRVKKKRVKGVWDPALKREYLVLKGSGRTLTYFLDGPPPTAQNKPKKPRYIFVFHGMFLSGNTFITKEPPKDYVLVCVNRPGYFGSSGVDLKKKDYSYKQFADDISQLADHLGIDTFAVAGHSSGGPCTLACAYYMPDRVVSVGILSGDAEYAHPGVDRNFGSDCGKLPPVLLQTQDLFFFVL